VALLPLLTLPWIGLRFVERMAEVGRDERLQNQALAVRALAASLHQRRDLFEVPQAGGEPTGRDASTRPPGRVQPMPVQALREGRFDGRIERWAGIARHSLPVARYNESPVSTLKVRFALARVGEAPGKLYLLVDADDERWLPPQVPAPGDDSEEMPGDLLRIEVGDSPESMSRVPVKMVERPGGWRAEVALGRTPKLLRLRVIDIDYAGSRQVEAEADSGLLAPDPGVPPDDSERRQARWADTLRALERTSGRISVYDASGVLQARLGEINAVEPGPLHWQAQLARALIMTAVRIRPDSVAEISADPTDRSLLSPLARALAGTPAQQVQRLAAQGTMPSWLLTSAYPIWIDDHVVGALQLEDDTAARLGSGQNALERLTLLAALAVGVSVLALMAVASITVGRIVRLRNEAEAAIDHHGRVIGAIRPTAFADEIGDLRSTHARVLARLREHQDYLVKLRGRLVHELRTPIMVVRSSLENLALESDAARREAYMSRVQDGAARLEHILTRMGEAASLESMLAQSERETVDLVALTAACVDGYRDAFAPRRFELRLAMPQAQTRALCRGVPEAIAQALDKLVANAVDFAKPQTAIVVELGPAALAPRSQARARFWQLSVRNEGPGLPSEMVESLFDQMVSMRAQRGGEGTHLGLGLYLVRLIAEFHGGQAFARDVAGGVEVGLTLRAEDHETP
jgi:signal transduction histidine kinase